jgi:F-type H+-transporting ATPase subunit alpha
MKRITEVMKQKQYSPLSVAEMAIELFAVDKGFMDDVAIAKISQFDHELLTHVRQNHQDFLAKVNESGDFNDDIANSMKKIIEAFKQNNTWA